ncbi:hypothetical protein IAQ61_003377 [Plenodomus lingam]|uniref:uncharacterized protein n=1 Tax=Leptosphaeria maculans TaxID=5022 RepID=UPI00332C9B8B|nr:hypothetical protein IAQ61_003377 [Plenodomus lingam]
MINRYDDSTELYVINHILGTLVTVSSAYSPWDALKCEIFSHVSMLSSKGSASIVIQARPASGRRVPGARPTPSALH